MTSTPQLHFLLNGKKVVVDNPSPETLLVDYLRSPEVHLTGTKKPCGQGGCGGCTVILSDWPDGKLRHRAINSCLRRLCSVHEMAVTTIEGTTGSVPESSSFIPHRMAGGRGGAQPGAPLPRALLDSAETLAACRSADNTTFATETVNNINPVAHTLAINNGSQCGYCSVGFVMNMSELITTQPGATEQDVEDAFDGNLCRCTGYRPILTGMRTLAGDYDWNSDEEHARMRCFEDPPLDIPRSATVNLNVPSTSPFTPPQPFGIEKTWLVPSTMSELAQNIADASAAQKKFRLIQGGTSFGVYPEEFDAVNVDVFILLSKIQELSRDPVSQSANELTISATATYEELIAALKQTKLANPGDYLPDSYLYMLRRTAGRIVRNTATIGGNLMMMLRHIDVGEPFPSDVATALYADKAIVYYYKIQYGEFSSESIPIRNLVESVRSNDPALGDAIVISHFSVFLNGSAYAQFSSKVALREVNSHTIVNMKMGNDNVSQLGGLDGLELAIGGIDFAPWCPSDLGDSDDEFNYNWVVKMVPRIYDQTIKKLNEKDIIARSASLPSEGITNEYKAQAAAGLFFKLAIKIFLAQGGRLPNNRTASAAEIKWGDWGLSSGLQKYAKDPLLGGKDPVAQPFVKSTALAQCSGQTHYTHELPYPQGTLHAAFVQSKRALANFAFKAPDGGDLEAYLLGRYPETFRRLITRDDIPAAGLNFQGMGLDQPLFATDLDKDPDEPEKKTIQNRVHYVGQSIALVLATTEQDARRIAEDVSSNWIEYSVVSGGPWTEEWVEPVLDLEDAIKRGSIFPDLPDTANYLCHIWKITRPRSNFDWAEFNGQLPEFTKAPETKNGLLIDGISCTRVINNQQTGGQAHFYLETQACLAIPADEGRIVVNSSTQSPMEMQQTVAMTLGCQYNKVKLQTRLLGGGFGGKTEQTRFTTGPTALAAAVTNAPVRLAMERDADTAMIGKRHAIIGEGRIAVDDGTSNGANKGVIKGMHLSLWLDGGAYYDCSYVVSNCIQTRIDNAYMIQNFESVIDVCRTNTAPSTAMRGFGDLQAKNVQENLIDDAAAALDMRPEDLREKNFYLRGEVTPYGQTLTACYMKEVWEYLKKQCAFDEQLQKVKQFNDANKWRKQGIALIPVKYGSGYNFEQLKQSSAIVVVNQADGSVVIHQGGVDMGQGLLTQVRQVAAYVLGIPMALIHVESPQTDTTPNTSSSGASTGTPYSAEAVKRTCEQLRQRLLEFGYGLLKDNGDTWCKENGVDFWNYGTQGWAAEVIVPPEHPDTGRKSLIWQNLVQQAYVNRLGLTTAFNVDIEHGDFDMPALTFKQPGEQPADPPGIVRDKSLTKVADTQKQFVGFTYSAACAVAEVDILTGETKILSADLVYDIGWSLNPALDIGQIEGAFVQGVGFLLTENLVTQPRQKDSDGKLIPLADDVNVGRLNTVNTWRYKIPAHVTIPLKFNVSLFDRGDDSVSNIPPDDQGIFSAKEVGEPPLILANSVFFAIKDAVRESRKERGLSALFTMRAPATPQEVANACEVDFEQFPFT